MEEINPIQSNMDQSAPSVPLSPEPSTTEDTHTRLQVLILATLVVVLLLLGIFLWGSSMEVAQIPVLAPPVEITSPVNAPEEIPQVLPPLSPSDEIEALEADLNTVDTQGLDAEFEAFESELDTTQDPIDETVPQEQLEAL